MALSGAARRAALRKFSEEERERLFHEWEFWARPKQYWRAEWEEQTTLWMTGRGFGKTRCGAETVHMVAEKHAEMCDGEIALIGQTSTDMRDIMIEGKSGILATSKPWFMPIYEPSKTKITWPNGVVAHLRTSEKPKLIRGLSVGFAWCDEIAHWMNPEECWDNLQWAMREGSNAKIVATTTPIPTKFVKGLATDRDVRLIRGSTGENAENLERKFLPRMRKKYGGTKKGRQEEHGEIVESSEHAPFQLDWISRIARDEMPQLVHLAIGVDPSGGTASKKSDENGIVGAGIDAAGNLYTLVDRSGVMSAAKWAAVAVDLAMSLRVEYRIENVVHIVGEINFGGDMVERVVKASPKWMAAGLRFKMVRAFANKATRAEPIAQLAENHRYYHVGTGTHFRDLETQMTTFDQTLPRGKQPSPDRMDAMVHVATYLLELLSHSHGKMKQFTREEMRGFSQRLGGRT